MTNKEELLLKKFIFNKITLFLQYRYQYDNLLKQDNALITHKKELQSLQNKMIDVNNMSIFLQRKAEQYCSQVHINIDYDEIANYINREASQVSNLLKENNINTLELVNLKEKLDSQITIYVKHLQNDTSLYEQLKTYLLAKNKDKLITTFTLEDYVNDIKSFVQQYYFTIINAEYKNIINNVVVANNDFKRSLIDDFLITKLQKSLLMFITNSINNDKQFANTIINTSKQTFVNKTSSDVEQGLLDLKQLRKNPTMNCTKGIYHLMDLNPYRIPFIYMDERLYVGEKGNNHNSIPQMKEAQARENTSDNQIVIGLIIEDFAFLYSYDCPAQLTTLLKSKYGVKDIWYAPIQIDEEMERLACINNVLLKRIKR